MRAGQVRQGTHIVEAGRKQQDGAPTAVAGTAGHTEAGERIALVRGDTVEPLVVALHAESAPVVADVAAHQTRAWVTRGQNTPCRQEHGGRARALSGGAGARCRGPAAQRGSRKEARARESHVS